MDGINKRDDINVPTATLQNINLEKTKELKYFSRAIRRNRQHKYFLILHSQTPAPVDTLRTPRHSMASSHRTVSFHPPLEGEEAPIDDAVAQSFECDDEISAPFDNLFSAQTETRRRALQRMELLACKFVSDVEAATHASELPPKIYGAKGAMSGTAVADVDAVAQHAKDAAIPPSDADVDWVVDGSERMESSDGYEVACRYVGDGEAYERFWEVLEVLVASARRDDCSSQMMLRELYYILLSRSHRNGRGTDATVINDGVIRATLRKISAALGAPRCTLGLCAVSKGQVAGRCHLELATGLRIDCTSVGNGGWPISGDLFELAAMKVFSDALYVLVIEKDAVFERLVSEKCFERLPAVLVTARGFPDIATRKFLHVLKTSLEDAGTPAKFFGLVDWNPHGLWILSTYSVGCDASAMDASQFTVPLEWLGLRTEDLVRVPECSLQNLSIRDVNMIDSALARENPPAPIRAYGHELHAMKELGKKAEIEALYANNLNFDLTGFITQKIHRASESVPRRPRWEEESW